MELHRTIELKQRQSPAGSALPSPGAPIDSTGGIKGAFGIANNNSTSQASAVNMNDQMNARTSLDMLSSSAPSGRPSHLALLMSAMSSPESQERTLTLSGELEDKTDRLDRPTASAAFDRERFEGADTQSIISGLSIRFGAVRADSLRNSGSFLAPISTETADLPPPRPAWDQNLTHIGYLKISDSMLEEICRYRRTLIIVILAFLYALFGMGSVVFRVSPVPAIKQRHLNSPTEEWTQTMIAGWHRDRLIKVVSTNNLTSHHPSIRIRECRSQILLKQHELALQQQLQIQLQQQKIAQLSGSLNTSSMANTTTKSTTTPASEALTKLESSQSKLAREDSKSYGTSTTSPISTLTSSTTSVPNLISTRVPTFPPRRQREFEALNGCLFRRDLTSNSLGDLCCCSGPPRFVLVEELNQANRTTTTSTISSSSTTTAEPNATANSSSPVRRQRRKYLRPQLICFATTSAILFNVNKQVAAIANEQSLKDTFASGESQAGGVGGCIVCSCCHEHEPDYVNRVLAGVPIQSSASKSWTRPLNQLSSSSRELFNGQDQDIGLGQESTGFWTQIRPKVVEWMRWLDDLFFWIFDLCEMSILLARYGSHQDSLNRTDASGLLLFKSMIVRPASLDAPRKLRDPKVIESQLQNLMIDESIYDDFTTKTPTTTSTSTSTTTTTSTTTSTTNRPSTSRARKRVRGHFKSAKHHDSSEANGTYTDHANTNLTSTSKAPTVIINLHLLDRAKTQSTSTTRRPLVEPRAEPSEVPNLELRIKLTGDQLNAVNNSLVVASTNSSSATSPDLTNQVRTTPSKVQPAPIAVELLSPAKTASPMSAGPTRSGFDAIQRRANATGSRDYQEAKLSSGNSTAPAIVISLGQGNSTTIIATINATDLSAAQPSSTTTTGAPSLATTTQVHLVTFPVAAGTSLTDAPKSRPPPGAATMYIGTNRSLLTTSSRSLPVAQVASSAAANAGSQSDYPSTADSKLEKPRESWQSKAGELTQVSPKAHADLVEPNSQDLTSFTTLSPSMVVGAPPAVV